MNKKSIVITVILILTAYGFGRWSAPEKIKIETKTVEIEKKTIEKDKKTTIVEKVGKDGSKETTTVIDEKTKEQNKNSNKSETSKEVTGSKSRLTIAAAQGFNLGSASPFYGVYVQKPVLGPITLGGFVFTNKTAGFTLGLTF